MVLIRDHELNKLQQQKQFEFDFQSKFWPIDPFGGLWIDEDLASEEIIKICQEAQKAISEEINNFAIEHRQCFKSLKGRIVIKISAIWWDSNLELQPPTN